MTTKRALVCAPLMPEFDRESGSRRVLDLILFLRQAGWAVSFAAENGRGGERYAEMLRQLGVATYDRFGPETDELMSSGCLDLAVCVFWYTADKLSGKLRRRTPRTRVIVDTIDLHFLRHARGLLGGTMDGEVLAGPFEGRHASLAALSPRNSRGTGCFALGDRP